MSGVTTKMWGGREFWGVGSDFDHDWVFTPQQLKIKSDLMAICRKVIRPHAIHCDKTYEFPRKSMEALAEIGLLGLIVPKQLAGLGQSHVCLAMVVETIARYGCPSTALVYSMHSAGVAALLLRHHKNARIKDLLSCLDKDKLIGTLVYSDPATGGHFWFPLSSKCQYMPDGKIKLLKFGSWATSAGCADWYAAQTVSPEYGGDYSDLSVFLVYKDEIRASTDDWSALGMHGNQSGPIVVEGVFEKDRMIGLPGDGQKSNDEVVDCFFFLQSSSAWNGLSYAMIDLAKKHVTRKAHADAGMRICDYPTIQDYFGHAVCSTNASRSNVYLIAQELDRVTNNNDWSKHSDPNYLPRTNYLHWMYQMKYTAASNVNEVADKMLHACGGTGYKTDLGMERLFRDAKAGWVMGASNEYARQLVGKSSLMGLEIIDFWEQNCNERAINHELGKMSLSNKKALAYKLLQEVQLEESNTKNAHPFQDSDFENPFNTKEPFYSGNDIITGDGKSHSAALNPQNWISLKLLSKAIAGRKMASFTFSYQSSDSYSGCLPGQYIQVRAKIDGKMHFRYFSPVSRPEDFGKIELVLRFESQGIISNFFKELKTGESLEFLGPCGGFEYEPNKLQEMTLLAAGSGITPGMQLIRSIISNPNDKTNINLLYYSDSVDDILYYEELNSYKDSDKLKVFYTLSEVTEEWDGDEGFIDTEMIKKHVPKPNGVKHKIIMCGGPTMAVSCLHSLRSLGFTSETIFIYGQFGTQILRSVYGRNSKLSYHTCDVVV